MASACRLPQSLQTSYGQPDCCKNNFALKSSVSSSEPHKKFLKYCSLGESLPLFSHNRLRLRLGSLDSRKELHGTPSLGLTLLQAKKGHVEEAGKKKGKKVTEEELTWQDVTAEEGAETSTDEEDIEFAEISDEEITFDDEEGEFEINETEDLWGDEDDEGEAQVGDGGDGGGVAVGGSSWGQLAMEVAESVLKLEKYGASLALYGFQVLPDRVLVRIRLDKLSDRYGSPTLMEIEEFSRDLNEALEKAGTDGAIPSDVAVEVSSPGAERFLRIPGDLERFKEIPMFVKYSEGDKVMEEVLNILEVDDGNGFSSWKVANVRMNREAKGKGRGLSKKQRERVVKIQLSDIKFARLFLDV